MTRRNRFMLAAMGFLAAVGGLEAQEPVRPEDSTDSKTAFPTREARAWPTPGEAQGWFAPTTPRRAAEYLETLAGDLPGVTVDTLALLGEYGEEVADASSGLPVQVVRISAPGSKSDTVRRVRVLIIGGQRGDEPSTLEAALQVARELGAGDLARLLDHLVVAIVPAVNPWGLLWWVPEDPSGIDPSTDHALLRLPASRAVHELAARWDPHLVIELGEIGPTVYRVQAGLSVHPNVHPDLVRLGRFYLLPYVAHELTKASISFRDLVVEQPERLRRAPLVGGAAALPEGSFLAPGELGADHALSSLALAGHLSVFLGVASLEGVEGLDVRVQLHYQALKALLEVAAGQAMGLTETVDAAAELPNLVGATPGQDPRHYLTLRYRFEVDQQRRYLTWRVWNRAGLIQNETTDRWRPTVRRLLALPVPAAWMIEPDAKIWADLVRAHGFRIERLVRETSVEVLAYPVDGPDRLPPDFAADLPPDSARDASPLLIRMRRDFPAGTWVVRSDQPGVRLLFTLLEPWSDDAPLGGGTDRGPGRDSATRATRAGVYPVYRVDADAVRRLHTEAVQRAGTRSDGVG